MKDSILSIVRHMLTFGGGYVVAKGWADEVTMTALVGAIITLAGGAWGIFEKINRPVV